MKDLLAARGGPTIPQNFAPTAPAYDPAGPQRGRMPQRLLTNPQTVQLLEMLGLPYNLEQGGVAGPGPSAAAPAPASGEVFTSVHSLTIYIPTWADCWQVAPLKVS